VLSPLFTASTQTMIERYVETGKVPTGAIVAAGPVD
jgi:hypothetical protein